jgi:hypothetical protein
MSEREYGLAREKARIVGCDPLLVPDWAQMQVMPPMDAGTTSLPVDNTHAPAFQEGRSLLLWESYDYCEVCAISSIGEGTVAISATTQSYTDAVAIPLRTCTFAQAFEGERIAAHYNTARAHFLATATENMIDSTAVAYPTYLGDSLVTSPRETIRSAADGVSREHERFDSKLGGLANYALHTQSRIAMSLAITAQTAQERINLRTFLATVCGRWLAFWLPSWNADFVLTKDIVAGDSYIQIAAVDFANTYGIGTDVTLITTAGYFTPMRITSVVVDGNNERLYSAGAFSGGLAMANVDRVCKLTRSRFDADRIELQYLPGLAMTAVVPTQEVPT